jgi:hypothetical protein
MGEERLAQAREHRHGLERRVRRVGRRMTTNSSPPEPGHRVGLRTAVVSAARRRLQQLIARVVAQRVRSV